MSTYVLLLRRSLRMIDHLLFQLWIIQDIEPNNKKITLTFEL